MRVALMLMALLFASVVTGVAMGRYTINGAALAAGPGPVMPRGALDDDGYRPVSIEAPSAQQQWDGLDTSSAASDQEGRLRPDVVDELYGVSDETGLAASSTRWALPIPDRLMTLPDVPPHQNIDLFSTV